MDYPPSFDSIKERLEMKHREGGVVVMPYEKLRAVVQMLLEVVPVDEEWYLKTYPDVGEAVAAGIVLSAKEHYKSHGYLEGRLPHDIEVDETYYFTAYPDVAALFKVGGPSAKEHYLASGYREGRSPVPPAPSPSPGKGAKSDDRPARRGTPSSGSRPNLGRFSRT